MPTSNITVEYLPCIGCRANVPIVKSEQHAYIGASAGCWEIYSEVLGREYTNLRYASVHQLTVDSYAVQNPGTPSRSAQRSVALHLVSLYHMLELGQRQDQARAALKHLADSDQQFVWLDPPDFKGELTILDVHAAQSAEEHKQRVRQWAASLWEVWKPYQEIVTRWAETTFA